MKQEMTAVICALNSKYVHSSLAPWYLLAEAEARCLEGVSVRVFESTINREPGAVADEIAALRPDVIAFSCYIWNIGMVEWLISQVKKQRPDARILLGGPEVSYRAGEILAAWPLVDFVLSGEGEEPFARLLNALHEEKLPDGIPGVSWRRSGALITQDPHITDSEPRSPYTAAYFAALGGRIAYLETSRGCPFSCAFCLSGRGGGVRFFDLDRAKRDILLLCSCGSRTVKFVDRTFNCNPARARELFRFVIERYGREIPAGVCFHFEIAGDLLDGETLDLLETAPPGAIQFEIGVQSFREETLFALCRRCDVERLSANVLKLVSFGNIHTHIDLIAGLPQENLALFRESFNRAYALSPHRLQLGFLKLLHGSAMRGDPEMYPCRFDEAPPYEVRETPWLTAGELRALHSLEDALERLYNSGRFRRTLSYVLQAANTDGFSLFSALGASLRPEETAGMSLDRYTELVFLRLSELPGVDPLVLRDRMVCDRLSTDASGRLPKVLQVQDPALRLLKRALQAQTPPEPGVRRGAALLYHPAGAVYADYSERNPVTGEYRLIVTEETGN